MTPTPDKLFVQSIQDALYMQLMDEVLNYLQHLEEGITDNTDVIDRFYEYANEHVFNDNLQHLK